MLERIRCNSLVIHVAQVSFEDENDSKRHDWVDRVLKKNPLTRLDVDINKTKQKEKERSSAAKDRRQRQLENIKNVQKHGCRSCLNN